MPVDARDLPVGARVRWGGTVLTKTTGSPHEPSPWKTDQGTPYGDVALALALAEDATILDDHDTKD